MQVKINDKILSLPPYLSTDWSHIAALHLKSEGILNITLVDGETVTIPHLGQDVIERIFNYHAKYLESDHADSFIEEMKMSQLPPSSLSFSIGMGSPMQHDPSQANAPDVPPEVLEKIAAVAKIFNPEETKLLPPPEYNCNCFHCQVLRALNPTTNLNELPHTIEEAHYEIVPDEELRFEQWGIIQIADKLFTVTNKLDTIEHYNVFLGDPVGCTCGKSGCEHILAVLKS